MRILLREQGSAWQWLPTFKDNRNAIKEGQVEPIQPVGKFLEAQILSRDPGIREREGVPRPEDIVEAEFSVVGPEGN